MEEAGAQVASPFFIRQTLSSRFHESPSMAKKRDLNYGTPSSLVNLHHHQQNQRAPNHGNNWNPKLWDWDSVGFVAKPLETDIHHVGTPAAATSSAALDQEKQNQQRSGVVNNLKKGYAVDEDDEALCLNLGGRLGSSKVEEPVTRPNKKVRSGSPSAGFYPMCQVDNCKEDLTNAKEYHRRHKVCEVHSKSSKTLVAKQMQRFCQQCSRFHPLSEFDEGKRSCRRRLAGHNRRRRKTQPEDVTSQLASPGSKDGATPGNLDIVNLLTAIACAQGNIEEKSKNGPCLSDKEQLIQILSKINTLSLPTDLAKKLPSFGNLNGKFPERVSEPHNKLRGNTSSPLTMDLLAGLSATLVSTAPDATATLSQKSSQTSDSEKSRLSSGEQASDPNLHSRQSLDINSVGGERSSSSYQSTMEESDCQVPDARVNLPLQLFSSSLDDDRLPKLASNRKYFSSDSSNPVEERSPSCSPPVTQKLFMLQGNTGGIESQKISMQREPDANMEASQSQISNAPFNLFRGSNRRIEPNFLQRSPLQAGYASSGSDHSPPHLNRETQDRTGRISFKLFDKDPSHIPGKLRAQIYNWLSNSPSEMESYIRPGCVILSVYISMSSAAWEKLEENLLQNVSSLIQSSDCDFWRNGRFLVHAGRQLASHRDGKIRVCKSWSTLRSPELISVSPLAIVGGQETFLSLKGRNLMNPGTRIHCTNMGGYMSKEIIGSTNNATKYDVINLSGFKVDGVSPGVLGRCFIEVENGFKGNCFPVIIADAMICKELRLLECEFDTEAKAADVILEDHSYDLRRPSSREEVFHFLNELGWLFQRKRSSYEFEVLGYSVDRFKFLLTFSVERNCCALVKKLLDMLAEKNVDEDWLSKESMDMLNEIQLLNQAVKRRCTKMVELLINYSISNSTDASCKYIFPPNLEGPGDITPLHIAACTLGSDDIIDALTNDPQEIGLNCWNSLVDANGQTPHAYAAMRNNHSYNILVNRKLANRGNGEISVTIEIENEQQLMTVGQEQIDTQSKRVLRPCMKCSFVAMRYNKRVRASQGLLHRPYIHSMLAIAAVCVCVCLFFRGAPEIGLVAPFKWENLDYGTM